MEIMLVARARHRHTATRARLVTIALALVTIGACAPGTSTNPPPSVVPAASPGSTATGTASTTAPRGGDLVIAGRILTLAEPPVAEAVFIDDGIVVAVGTLADVSARAGDQVPVMNLGENVAYPGFVDAHAHWIGDRKYYGIDSPAAAIDAAITRGWTSISEQWVNPERLDELTSLAATDALPLRVDAYLALNYDKDFLGDWYLSRERPVDDHLRVQGLKIHLDDGYANVVNWEPADLTETTAGRTQGRPGDH